MWKEHCLTVSSVDKAKNICKKLFGENGWCTFSGNSTVVVYGEAVDKLEKLRKDLEANEVDILREKDRSADNTAVSTNEHVSERTIRKVLLERGQDRFVDVNFSCKQWDDLHKALQHNIQYVSGRVITARNFVNMKLEGVFTKSFTADTTVRVFKEDSRGKRVHNHPVILATCLNIEGKDVHVLCPIMTREINHDRNHA